MESWRIFMELTKIWSNVPKGRETEIMVSVLSDAGLFSRTQSSAVNEWLKTRAHVGRPTDSENLMLYSDKPSGMFRLNSVFRGYLPNAEHLFDQIERAIKASTIGSNIRWLEDSIAHADAFRSLAFIGRDMATAKDDIALRKAEFLGLSAARIEHVVHVLENQQGYSAQDLAAILSPAVLGARQIYQKRKLMTQEA
jgi:hypothetical protein